MWFVTLGLKLIGFLGGANVGSLITGVTDVIKNNTNAEVINNQTGANLGTQYLLAVAETEKVKAEHQTERQIIFGILAFAVPAAILWWGACLDSVPWDLPWMDYPHRKGSWGIGIPPAFDADFHMIVQSFFIAAPALAGVSMLARAFKK